MAIPAAVTALADGEPLRPVWANQVGGITFELGSGDERRFLKWAPTASGIDLAVEAARMRWAVAFARVPRIIEQGESETGSWLVTAALPGESAVSERWRADPRSAVIAIGAGLRALHDALPAESCPFSWGAEERVADAVRRAEEGLIDPANWHPMHQGLGVEKALAIVADVPPVDRLVVCHGDTCAPNTLLTDDGRWSGHVDLGELGVADRWADLAVATWSTQWNYGPGWEEPLRDAYGIAPDPERTRYYRLLWDLGP